MTFIAIINTVLFIMGKYNTCSILLLVVFTKKITMSKGIKLIINEGYFGLALFFVILDLDGVGIPLGLGPIPVAVWAVDDGETGLLADLGM